MLWFGDRACEPGALQRGLLQHPVAEEHGRRGQGGGTGEAAAQASGLGLGLGAWGQLLTLSVCCGFFWRTEKQSSSRGWVGLDSIRQALTRVRCLEPGSATPAHPHAECCHPVVIILPGGPSPPWPLGMESKVGRA